MTQPTQEDDVKALKDALALGPTLGKWSVDGHFGEWGISSDHSVGGACKSGRQFVAACFRVSKKDTPKYAAMFEATARYIAEANPERIARLLARLEQAERRHSDLVAVLVSVVEIIRNLDDKGPHGEGWQSWQLETGIKAIDAHIAAIASEAKT